MATPTLPFQSLPLERLLHLHAENPTDETCAWEITRIARRTMTPEQWFKLLFVELSFDLGFVWPKLHGQESIFRAVVGWVAGDGTAGVIDGKSVQMVSERITKAARKSLGIKNRQMLRAGKLSETTDKGWEADRPQSTADQPGLNLYAYPDMEGIMWEHGTRELSRYSRKAGKMETVTVHGIYLAIDVYEPPSRRDVLVLCVVSRPDGEVGHPDNPGPYGKKSNTQHLYLWGSTPFEARTPAKQGELQGLEQEPGDNQYAVLRWHGYGFKSHKSYSGATTAQSKVGAVVAMLDQLDLAPSPETKAKTQEIAK